MNGAPPPGDDVALFIDWENFKISLATGHRTPNVSALKEEVSNYGRVVVAKAYADWVSRAPELRGASQFTNDPPALYAAGIEPVYVPTRLPATGASPESFRTARIKNSVDVKMTADCIECAHSYLNIGTYVLVSGDSDFIHVVNTLRAMGKRVIIVGVSWSTSRRLADQVDGLILYDTDVDPVTPAEPAPVGNGRGPHRLSSPGRQQLPEVIAIIDDIVRSERQAGRTPLLTSLKQRIMRRIPGFDEKALGFSGFKKLMQRAAQEGNIKLVTVGLVDWVLMADEPDPEEAPAEAAQTGEPSNIVVGQGVVQTSEATPSPELAPDTPMETGEPAVSAGNGNGRKGRSSRRTVEAAETRAPNFELAGVMAEELPDLQLPEGPDDGWDGQRVADLIIMADTLEHREGISHVAFNFLVGEVCQALNAGLEAEQEEIALRWGEMHSRLYITRMLRSLSTVDIFRRDWHTAPDEETGASKRRRTFNLNRSHSLVQKILAGQWDASSPRDGTDSELPSPRTEEILPDMPPLADVDDLALGEATADTADDPAFGFNKVLRFFGRS